MNAQEANERTIMSEYPNTQLLIAGDWCDGSGNRKMPVYNPATGL